MSPSQSSQSVTPVPAEMVPVMDGLGVTVPATPDPVKSLLFFPAKVTELVLECTTPPETSRSSLLSLPCSSRAANHSCESRHEHVTFPE